jgi:3-methylcrotonyl-CoA carboxylase alpha subunit
MIDSLLIANRGEIACRIMRTARRLGLRSVAVYSDADRNSLHVRLADEAVYIGAAPARESYLDGERILDAAVETRAAAIHPGYGFLAENAAFADACRARGIVFVGPPGDSIRQMGSKSEARQLMARAGVPVLPGYDDEDQADARLIAEASRLGFPLLIKPTAGGGGKGMRVVRALGDFPEALAGARREAQKSFGDARVLLERFVEQGRHVEIQVFADSLGHAVHLFERDCSLQRRHQKVIEEAPAPGLDESTRSRMGEAAVRAAQAVAYQGAGTVEFLYDGNNFYFLEMNTRLQVEHPVTEMITGLDLVEWQLRVASGEALPLGQQQLSRRGHAVEARLYAEDPERSFLPSTGRLQTFEMPQESADLRVDSGFQSGDEVSVHYDPLLAKIIAWAPDRLEAMDALRSALEQCAVDGVRTNARFLWEILGAEPVRSGQLSTRLLERELQPAAGVPEAERLDAWLLAAAASVLHLPGDARGVADPSQSPWKAATGYRINSPPVIRVALRLGEEREWLQVSREAGGLTIIHGGRPHRVEVTRDVQRSLVGRIDGRPVLAHYAFDHESLTLRRQCLRFDFAADTGAEHRVSAAHEGHISSPMPGHVLELRVSEGQQVEAGAVVLVLEAMKMEHSLTAPWAGRVSAVKVKAGDRVEEGVDLVVLEPLGQQ